MQRLLSLRKLHLPKTQQCFSSPSLLTHQPWRSHLPHKFPVQRLVTLPSTSLSRLGLSDRRIWFRRVQFYCSSSSSRGGALDSTINRRRRKQWFQGLSRDQVVLGLIYTNVAVFMLWQTAGRDFMMKNFMISLDNIQSGRLHTIVTHAFSHASAGHLMSNMIGLFFFGNSIAKTFGPEALLKLYLVGATGGAIFYLLYNAYLATKKENQGAFMIDPSRRPGFGASGAVNAIVLLDILLFPKKTILLEFIIPVPAFLVGILLVGKDVLRIIVGDSQISGSAHLGGAAIGALAWARVRKTGRLF